jgi:predicted DNA-binding protein
MASSTTSIRVPDDLKNRLEETAKFMGKPQNWIISRAIEEYLNRHSHQAIEAEARRQSILVSSGSDPMTDAWLDSALEDIEGWK